MSNQERLTEGVGAFTFSLFLFGSMAQRSAHPAHNRAVLGSNPSRSIQDGYGVSLSKYYKIQNVILFLYLVAVLNF